MPQAFYCPKQPKLMTRIDPELFQEVESLCLRKLTDGI